MTREVQCKESPRCSLSVGARFHVSVPSVDLKMLPLMLRCYFSYFIPSKILLLFAPHPTPVILTVPQSHSTISIALPAILLCPLLLFAPFCNVRATATFPAIMIVTCGLLLLFAPSCNTRAIAILFPPFSNVVAAPQMT